ncbi:transposase [Geomonas paludis]|uniref:Transposase n=1 Tax=Geomonas paludis TaxID=2740185 RepID=A0ABY4LII2_9BACT|nr:transposase [Geomonas paludis]UPU36307.1 transposase [Geomonas paludis]
MPRQARIDAPGACHHIICRGIERRKIFLDDTDRDRFLLRLGQVLKKSSTRCFAWALIPNHFHLLLQTGNTPISDVMRRLTTGYAVEFNHRHNRSGHLFQNRYKSRGGRGTPMKLCVSLPPSLSGVPVANVRGV